MHSSRMRTNHSLTVCWSLLRGRGAGVGMQKKNQKKSKKKSKKNIKKIPPKFQGGVPGPRGVYLVPGGCTWSRGVYLVQGGVWTRGVSGPGGVWSRGCLVLGGMLPGGGVVSQHVPRQTSPHEQNDKQV